MRKSLLAFVALAAALNFCASAAFAGPIEDRQAAMKANGQTMKILGGMAQGESPFVAAVVKEQGEAMAARFDAVRNLFPPGSDKGPPETYAKAEIWSDPEGFTAALDKAMNASLALAAVTDEAQLKEAVGNVGGTCKNCHDKYTRPKD
ncbi:MAG TPA: cytochrome c [Aestuariivirgaceae bacterium]|nr:cytochrome c [Aestuariivirgaceae bacterium]